VTFAELYDLAKTEGWTVRIIQTDAPRPGRPPHLHLWVLLPTNDLEPFAVTADLRKLSLDAAAGRIVETMRELGAIK
jgi:hypothetical protein